MGLVPGLSHPLSEVEFHLDSNTYETQTPPVKVAGGFYLLREVELARLEQFHFNRSGMLDDHQVSLSE